MDDIKELAWRHFSEHCTQGRHHEVQRANVSQYTVAVAAVMGTLVSIGGLNAFDIPLAFLMMILGLFGALFSAKQHERFSYHMEQATAFRNELERLEPALDSRSIRRGIKEKHRSEFPHLESLKLHRFWIALHLFVALAGFALLLIVVFAGQR